MATVALDVSGLVDGDVAGLSVFQVNYAYIGVKKVSRSVLSFSNLSGGVAKVEVLVLLCGLTLATKYAGIIAVTKGKPGPGTTNTCQTFVTTEV